MFAPRTGWLSQGKVLSCLYELHKELLEFSREHAVPHKDTLVDERWCSRLSYLADIFGHLNELNAKLQGWNENILSSTDNIRAFMGKIILWHGALEQGSMDMFPLASAVPQAASALENPRISHNAIEKCSFSPLPTCVSWCSLLWFT